MKTKPKQKKKPTAGKRRPVVLSFQVIEVAERLDNNAHKRFHTILRSYHSPNEHIDLLGKYWEVGTKVDFIEMPPLEERQDW